jgi:hypothetical protein
MKHLKSYKIFESKEDIVSNLRDICLELEDIGFKFHLNKDSDENTIEYIIHKEDSTRFKFSEDVIEVVDRIYQYMRELGWYSHLSYSLGGSIRKKFYIRPDGRMRNQDLLWMNENWPSVYSIEFFWYKIYEDKIANESISNTSKDVIDTLVWEYGEVIYDINKDIEFIEDKLLELSDLGYFTTINYSPMTYAGASSKPNIYIDIKNLKSREDFYGKLGENRGIVDSIIEDVLEYLESSGYKIKNEFDNRIQQPSEFKFINNPVSYQFVLGRE